MIFREKDTDFLIQGVCDALAATRWFDGAWIILTGTDIKPVTSASAGMGEGFLAIIDRFRTGEQPYCCQLALENPGVTVLENPEEGCANCPLSCGRPGETVMTRYLESRGRMYGFLYVRVHGNADLINELRGLVECAARDLSFALYASELERRQSKFQAMLKKVYEAGEIRNTDILASKYDWKDKLILIVEDHESSYLLLKEAIMKTRVQIFWSMNGKEALDICRLMHNIDLVLMDIRLPDMNGLEVARQIRKFRSELPIVAMTAYSTREMELKSREAGCIDYIAKPFSPETILSLVGEYLEKTPEPSDSR
jgi:CheY-like chemotaxis protein